MNNLIEVTEEASGEDIAVSSKEVEDEDEEDAVVNELIVYSNSASSDVAE